MFTPDFSPHFFRQVQTARMFNTLKDFSHLGLFAPKIVHTSEGSPPDYSHLGLFAPRIVHPPDFSHLGFFAPSIVHPPGLFTPHNSTDYSPLYMTCSPLILSFESLTPCWTPHSYVFNIGYSSFRDLSSFIIVETNCFYNWIFYDKTIAQNFKTWIKLTDINLDQNNISCMYQWYIKDTTE